MHNPITAKPGYSILNRDAPFVPNDGGREKIPVEHMEFAYITNCKDAKYLERILRRLNSGAEGAFPALVQHCEEKLRRLDPRNHSLRKDKPAASASSIPKDEWSDLVPSPQYWEEKERLREATLKEQSAHPESIPPVRSSFSIALGQNLQAAKPAKRAAPRDYREWDKFDVEEECEKIDADVTMEEPLPARKFQSMLEDEKSQTANSEIQKGNIAYKAGYYEKAVIYYGRSINVKPTLMAYNNKALAHIKQKDWLSAMDACLKALQLEPGNARALYYRDQVHKNQRKYETAAEDVRALLGKHPDLCEAKKPLAEIEKIRLRKGQSALDQRSLLCERPKDREAINLLPTVEEKMREGRGEAEQRSLLGKRTKDAEAIRPLPEVEKLTEDHRSKGKTILIEEEDDDSAEDTFASLKQEGKDFVKNEQYQDAMAMYSRCLEMKPNDPVVHSNRAQCYLKLKRFAEAKRDCDASLASEARAKTFYRRALAHKGLRDYPACIHDLEAVLRCEPDTPEAEKLLGVVLMLHLHDISASPGKCRRIVPLAEVEGDEEMEDVAEMNCCEREEVDCKDESVCMPPSHQDTEEDDDVPMEEKDPPAAFGGYYDGTPAWLDEQALGRAVHEKERGDEAYRDGLYERALADYSRSIEIVPTAAAFVSRAQALVRLGRLGDALSDCQTVLEQEPRHLTALLCRAEVRRNLGLFGEALDDLQLVLWEAPRDPAATRLLARVESERRTKGRGADAPELERPPYASYIS